MGEATPSLVGRMRRVWHSEVRARGNEPRFLSAGAFLATFLITRAVTHFLLATGGGGGLVIGDLHLHHMVFGLALVLISGLLDLVGALARLRAMLFGAGAALVLDEFALILNLADVYWAPQGRESIDAVVIFASALLLLVLGGGFWRAAGREIVRAERAVAGRIER